MFLELIALGGNTQHLGHRCEEDDEKRQQKQQWKQL